MACQTTIIISFVIGRIINYVFNNDNSCNSILKITITIYVIRWWVYYPIALFRTALLIPLVCFAFCKIFEKLTMSKVRKNVSSVSNNECI